MNFYHTNGVLSECSDIVEPLYNNLVEQATLYSSKNLYEKFDEETPNICFKDNGKTTCLSRDHVKKFSKSFSGDFEMLFNNTKNPKQLEEIVNDEEERLKIKRINQEIMLRNKRYEEDQMLKARLKQIKRFLEKKCIDEEFVMEQIFNNEEKKYWRNNDTEKLELVNIKREKHSEKMYNKRNENRKIVEIKLKNKYNELIKNRRVKDAKLMKLKRKDDALMIKLKRERIKKKLNN